VELQQEMVAQAEEAEAQMAQVVEFLEQEADLRLMLEEMVLRRVVYVLADLEEQTLVVVAALWELR
jgi:hypothetical protein